MRYKTYEIRPMPDKARICKGAPVQVFNNRGAFLDTKDDLAQAKRSIDIALNWSRMATKRAVQ